MSEDRGEGPGRRRAVIAAVGVLAVVAVGSVVIWLTRSDPGHDTDAEAAPGSEPAVFDEGRATEFEDALLSRDPQRLGEVLVVEEDLDLATIASEALPPGLSLDIDESTFEEQGEGFAVVDATITGGRRMEVTVFLVDLGGEWMMAGTTAPVPL